MSVDPLAVHGLGADLNLYAYVSGAVLKNVDPLGLQSASPAASPDGGGTWKEVAGGIASGVVTAFTPGASVGEMVHDQEAVEAMAGQNHVARSDAYKMAKGLTELTLSALQFMAGESAALSGATIAVGEAASGNDSAVVGVAVGAVGVGVMAHAVSVGAHGVQVLASIGNGGSSTSSQGPATTTTQAPKATPPPRAKPTQPSTSGPSKPTRPKTVKKGTNGRYPINSRYAGEVHPSGVRYKKTGYPDFTPHAVAQTKVKGLNGNYSHDAKLANANVNLTSTPTGYVWHHVEDMKTMQLVPQSVHDAARHTGGTSGIVHKILQSLGTK